MIQLVFFVLIQLAFSQSCGTSCQWSYLSDSQTLSITGNGDMNDYGWENIPWKLHLSSIKTVTIESGITSLSPYFLYKANGVETISIPESVTKIGNNAFTGCVELASISLPQQLKTISGSAFSGCTKLTSIIIPNSVTSID